MVSNTIIKISRANLTMNSSPHTFFSFWYTKKKKCVGCSHQIIPRSCSRLCIFLSDVKHGEITVKRKGSIIFLISDVWAMYSLLRDWVCFLHLHFCWIWIRIRIYILYTACHWLKAAKWMQKKKRGRLRKADEWTSCRDDVWTEVWCCREWSCWFQWCFKWPCYLSCIKHTALQSALSLEPHSVQSAYPWIALN